MRSIAAPSEEDSKSGCCRKWVSSFPSTLSWSLLVELVFSTGLWASQGCNSTCSSSLIAPAILYCRIPTSATKAYHCFLKHVVGNLKNIFYWFIFRERGREREREERNIYVWEKHWSVATHKPPDGDLACNPSMYPDWKSNQWPFTLWEDTQPTEPPQSRLW